MAKQQTYQTYIYKIHSSKIIKGKMKYNRSLSEMRRNNEIISLASSETLRFIDDINGLNVSDVEKKIAEIRKQIKIKQRDIKTADAARIKKIKSEIKNLYAQLDNLQIKPDYLAVIMDNPKDIDKLEKGFQVNGKSYRRLLGTPNGVKKSIVIYVSTVNTAGKNVVETNEENKDIYDILQRRLNNGRNLEKKHIPAKFEAYKALSCSASTPVTNPKGILVVDDLVLHFKSNILKLDDEFADETKHIEPIATNKIDDVELDNSDGYGLILPSLAKIWEDDLKLEYDMSGCCIRNSFLKGMVFVFDFREFADTIAHQKIVKDVWGQERNIDEVDMILTTSMLKLWDSYNSLEDYLKNCKENKYNFAVTKACPEYLDEERTLNYQFIQSYRLSDEQIEELIAPTVNEIKDVLGGDINKAMLFLRGTSVTEETADIMDDDCIKAMMIDSRMYQDPFVLNRINNLIKRRITDAKIGVVKVQGNYSIISGDPYALCQHIFKTNVDENGNDIEEEMGLLKTGEVYCRHWVDRDIDEVVCFRAPMSCHNNIVKVKVAHNDDIDHWYKYMKTATIINCHDAMTHSLNGADCDGDLVFTTNNSVLLNNWRQTPAIVCVQRSGVKQIITDDLLRKSNKDGFGDEIGTTTNHITAMFDVQSLYEENSREYQDLEYRIQCGQLYQQACIDKVKGIVSKPMPKYWYTRQSERQYDENGIMLLTDEELARVKYENSIAAIEKPYFMNYIYPQQKMKYDKYVKRANKKCIEEFNIELDTLIAKENKNDKEKDFINSYFKYLPSSDNNCVMNRLCHMVENHFDGYVSNIKQKTRFDSSILKSETRYVKNDFAKIKELYKQYNEELVKFMKSTKESHISDEDKTESLQCLIQTYRDLCVQTCPNEDELCNIVIDLCYTNDKSKQFAWNMCGHTIIQNLLKKNENEITYLTESKDGVIEYCGKKFAIQKKKVVDYGTDNE